MIRRAEEKDIEGLIELLYQVDAVHHGIRPDLFKGNTPRICSRETLPNIVSRTLRQSSLMRISPSSYMMKEKCWDMLFVKSVRSGTIGCYRTLRRSILTTSV